MSRSPEEISKINRQVDQIVSHDLFTKAPRLVALLRYLVQAELDGDSEKFGQYAIAVEVLGRDSDFDPVTDSSVRVEVGRLRVRLAEFDAQHGKQSIVRLKIPKGSYRPELVIDGHAETAHVKDAVQEIRFLQTKDHVSLAYAVSGSGPPLIKAANWLSHLEYDHHSPVWRHWWRDLSARYTLIRYDERGCGLSDWDVDDFSIDAWVRDLEEVAEKVGFEKFALLGISQGAAVAIRFAVRHPELVSHLVLYGGFAQGRMMRPGVEKAQEEATMLKNLVRLGWGQENAAFRRVFASLFIPEGEPEQFASFDELQRYSTSPENAERFLDTFNQIDVTDDLSKVSVPTLVLHARDELEIPLSQSKLMAKTIPDATLTILESNHHILGANEPAWPMMLDKVAQFLAR